MSTLQEWTLLVMFGILACTAGKLHEPLNLKTESRNFSLFLTWLPPPENPPNVTYNVEYMLIYKKGWWKVLECISIVTTECDLTCALGKNYSNLHTVRVRALSVSQRKSNWTHLSNISYMFTVVPSPPILNITQIGDSMIINASMQKSFCVPNFVYLCLKYQLEISNKNNLAEKKKIEMSSSSEVIKTDGYEGEYCMTAQTIYQVDKQKISEPSHAICLNFTQTDETYYVRKLSWLPLVICISAFFLCTIIWYKTHEKAIIPKVLTFTHTRYDLAVSVIPEENFYPLTIDKNMGQTSSATFLLSNEDSGSINKYPLSGCGYTERKTMPGIKSNCHHGDSTSDEYMSSKGLPTNSSSDKSSDSSWVQTSGSNTEMTLMHNKIQLHSQANEIISTEASVDMETLVTDTIGPLLDTSYVSNFKGFGDVLINTLTISAATDKCLGNEPYEYHLTDSEDEPEQLPNDCIDSDMMGSYGGSEILQQNGSSGYEQRGYMSRR